MITVCDFNSKNKNYILEYVDDEMSKIYKWEKKLKEFQIKKQKTVIWGAGAKGVIFANLFDPDKEYICAVVDINPNKQGKYLAGTGHEILGIKEMGKLNVDNVIVMNENYYYEIKKIISDNINKDIYTIKL